MRTADADVEKYLKLFTFLPLPEIREVIQEHEKDQSKRVAQHMLAKEFVELIYGHEAAANAEAEHRQLFNKKLTLSDVTASVAESKAAQPTATGQHDFINPSLNKHAQPLRREDNAAVHVKLPQSLVIGKPLSHVLWAVGLAGSRAEGQRLINAGGAYIGANADARGGMDDALSFTPAKTAAWEELAKFVIDGKILILRVGKWRLKIIDIIPDDEYEAAGLTCQAWDALKAARAVEHPRETPEQRPT